jgi:hypothetical protein
MMSWERRVVAVAMFVCCVAVLGATTASAQTTYAGATPPALGGVLTGPNVVAGTGTVTGTGTSPGQPLAAQVSAPTPVATQAPVSGLAFTGGDFVRLVLFAVPMIVLGTALTRMAKGRSRQA